MPKGPVQLLTHCGIPPSLERGPGGCGWESGSPLWCWGTGYKVRRVLQLLGALAVPVDKENPVWGPGHPCLLTQLCPCQHEPACEGGERGRGGTGSRAGFWTGGGPGEDFSAPPECTSCHSAWGNLVQKDTQSGDISSSYSLQQCLRGWVMVLGSVP